MNQETARLSSKAGSSKPNQGQANRHSERSATQVSIGQVMFVIAIIAIVLATATRVFRGSPALLSIIPVLLLVVLPSRKHLRLALGWGVKAKSNASAKNTALDPSRFVSGVLSDNSNEKAS
jgi:hypothetical protein